jgi:hypothetical protein
MKFGKLCSGLVVAASFLNPCAAQAPKAAVAQKPAGKARAAESLARVPGPKLVVLLVVDQMRGDYVDKFQGQWTGGLKRLVSEGAWFREAAYPYAATAIPPFRRAPCPQRTAWWRTPGGIAIHKKW